MADSGAFETVYTIINIIISIIFTGLFIANTTRFVAHCVKVYIKKQSYNFIFSISTLLFGSLALLCALRATLIIILLAAEIGEILSILKGLEFVSDALFLSSLFGVVFI